MNALERETRRIATGSAVLIPRAAQAFWADVPHRERAARCAAALAGAWIVGGIILASHSVLWILIPLWCLTARHAARVIERQAAADAALVQFIRDLIGHANGAHLAVIVDELTGEQDAPGDGWTFESLRTELERLEIPVRDSLKVAGGVSVGVHVDDLTHAWDVHLTTPPRQGQPLPDGKAAGNYPTTPRITQTAGEEMTIIYVADTSHDGTPPADDKKAEALRLLDVVNRSAAAREAFDDHFADALGILKEEVNES